MQGDSGQELLSPGEGVEGGLAWPVSQAAPVCQTEYVTTCSTQQVRWQVVEGAGAMAQVDHLVSELRPVCRVQQVEVACEDQVTGCTVGVTRWGYTPPAAASPAPAILWCQV